MHQAFFVPARLSLAASIVIAAGGVAAYGQDVAPAATDKPNDALSAEALQELEQASDAMARWQQAIEEGAKPSTEELAKLRDQLGKLLRDAEKIGEKAEELNDKQREQAQQRLLSSREQAQSWINQMRSLGEGGAERRAEAVAALKTALEGSDENRALAALQALQQVGDVNYDKAQFRPLVLPFVEKGKGVAFVAASYALFNTERKPEDLKLVQDGWARRTPALEDSMSHLLFMFGDGVIEGRSEEILLELLDSPHAAVRREALRGLWGADVSDKLAARVAELADDANSRHDAIYFGLSTFKPKNAVVVDKLIEALADPDWNNWDRALWGLGYGVPRDLQPKVAAALADVYTARSDPKVRETCRELIRQYAGDAAVDRLPR